MIAVTLQVRRCVNPACAFYHRPYRPELEGRLALPHHEFGLDVIAWIGACRYQEHGTVPEIHHALTGRGVVIAPRTVDHLLGRYEELVSVVLAAPAQRASLRRQGRLILAADGLQPDKGHEVLWVVREVLSGDILLARSLLASGCDDLSALLRAAVAGLEDLPVVGVISDGQLALRQAVADVFPDVPHQLCQFHYLREAGRPIWEADRHAQKELRKRVRGVRPIERAVEDRTDPQAEVIRGYCAAIRGALGDSGHPPLEPGGLHLQQRLSAITASLDRVAEKGGGLHRSAAYSKRCGGRWTRPRRFGRRWSSGRVGWRKPLRFWPIPKARIALPSRPGMPSCSPISRRKRLPRRACRRWPPSLPK